MEPGEPSENALVVPSRPQETLKPYGCMKCGKTFAKIRYLLKHVKYHDESRYTCGYVGCEARYAIKQHLIDHVCKIHTNVRQYKCTLCNASFFNGSSFYHHRLRHTNDRKYGCDICKKRFFRSDTLKSHIRVHTGEKPYNCEICGRNFRQKGTLDRHVWHVHPNSL